LLVSFVLLATTVPLRADEKADAAKKLNGTYVVTEMLLEGKPDNSKKDNVTFVFKDGTVTITEGEKKKGEVAKYTIDPSKKPAQIDVMPEKGSKEVLGIYELKETDKGTELIVSFVHDGGERPKDFKGEGKDVVVVKMFRNKDK